MTAQADPSPPLLRQMTAFWVRTALAEVPLFEDAVDKLRGATLIDEPITLAEFWQVGARQYFFLSALAQVRKCVLKLPSDNLPVVRDMGALRLLRDIHEHWEQVEYGRSLAEIKQRDPTQGGGSVRFNNKHIWLGTLTSQSWRYGSSTSTAQCARRRRQKGT